jgi:polyhydroxybutyrate depolymerase
VDSGTGKRGAPGHRRRLAALLITGALVLGAAGCPRQDQAGSTGTTAGGPPGSTAPPAATDVGGAPATGAARPSAGCASPPPAGTAPEVQQRTIDVDGTERDYRLYVPAGLPAGPVPLVLDIHGLGSNKEQQAAFSGWQAMADREHLVVAAPQGINNQWDINPGAGNRDVAFLRALIDGVQGERCLDVSRTYSNGISMGGLMSSVLACSAPDQIAAVGLVSGIEWKPACEEAPARPAMVFWGRKDCVLPWFGGLGPCLLGPTAPDGTPRTVPSAPLPPGADAGFPPVEDVVASWSAHNGCAPAPVADRITTHVERRTYGACRDGADVYLYVVDDGGHTWPGSDVIRRAQAGRAGQDSLDRGVTTDEIDATGLMWPFFQRFQLPAHQ